MYGEVKEKVVMPKLKSARYFSATTDFWSSNSNTPFMSFTVHLVDPDWHLQAFCLDTVPLFDDHTGCNICEAFQDDLTNWNLSMDQVVAVTTDNGSILIAAFSCADCDLATTSSWLFPKHCK